MKIVPAFIFKNAFRESEKFVNKIGFMNSVGVKTPFYG